MPFVRSLFTPRRMVGAGVAAVLIGSSITAIASTAVTTPAASLGALPSVIPGWAKTAKVVGQTPGNQTVFVGLTLKAPDEAGLIAYGKAATTPGNPLYRHWLTVSELQARYAPAAATVSTVSGLLKALGVSDIKVDKLGMSIMATMPASLASTIFGVRFQQVMHGGVSTRVAMNQPTLPSALLPYITNVSGLTAEPVHLDHVVSDAATSPQAAVPPITVPGVGAPVGYYNANPTSTYYGSTLATDKPQATRLAGEAPTASGTSAKPYTTSGYTPAQVRGAYGLDKTPYTGKGVTAAVVLFYDGQNVPVDLATYSTAFGLPAPNYTDLSPENQVTTDLVGTAVLDPVDAASEQTLDVEAIHQMAPNASIVYSGAVAPLDEPIYIADVTAITSGADVVNNSYGGVGDVDASDAMTFATVVTEPAMALGVGLDYSSGDGGDEVTAQGAREADSSSTSDEVTAVGGTGIEIGKNNDYEGEFYWGTYSSPALKAGDTSWGPFASQAGGAGGGGGLSTAYAEPMWQQGVVPAEETVNKDTESSYVTLNGSEPTYGVAGSPGRVTPDVALIADSTTGMLVGETQVPDVGTDGVAGDGVATYSYFRIGGTSVSSPMFTGIMADVDEALGTSAGFVNPTMYPFLARHDGAFRDPSIGRAAGASRLGGTMAQSLTGCTQATAGTTDTTTQTCTGTGPGVIPVVAEVRSDYTDTANPGVTDATSGTASGANPVVSHLRGQGVLGTLEDLPGFDDSTGLGSPCAPQFINDFLPGQPSAGSYCTTPAPTVSAATTTTTPVAPTPTPISSPVTVTSKPTTTTTSTSCTTVRTSSIKVYGPKTTKLNKHGQALYTFKLFINLGKCKAPSAVGRQFYVYVDGHKTATLRTGKGGVQTYLVRLTPGKHTITASFVGNKDLKKSASPKFSNRVI